MAWHREAPVSAANALRQLAAALRYRAPAIRPAMPLLVQLREDQKNEVRSLARIIGLDKVASMI